MNITYLLLDVGAILLPLTLLFLEFGWRLGRRRLAVDPRGARAGASAVEGAVFALFGLLIAFSFTSAASRYETRRNLIVDHTNAIGTAWLRLDLLPAEVQQPLRKDFRLYVEGIIKIHGQVRDIKAVEQTREHLSGLQDEIWKLAGKAVSADSRPQIATLVLPALNEMFDLGASRYAAARFHVSLVVIGFLIFLSMIASLLVGYGMASANRRNWLHMVLFALLISLTIFIIVDFEYPRYGIIRLDDADKLYLELHQAMR
jgi:ABC-type glycerol-3-phosphate transport system permease component